MAEVLIIISLSLIFIILLRRVPEVKIEGVSENNSEDLEVKEIIREIDREFDDKKREVIRLLSEAEKYFSEKDYQKAEESYLKIASLDPDNSRIYGRLGIIYLERKDYRDAVDAFIEAIKREPKNSFWYNNLGLVSHQIGDFQKSIKAFKRAIELDESASKYINLAKVYEDTKDYEGAISAIKSALEKDQTNPEYKRMLADLEAKTSIK